MKLQMVGCSHHTAKLELRERLAFNRDQATEALARLRMRYPETEAVLLSTCNRVELYVASQAADACPSHHDVVSFLAEFHGLSPGELFHDLFERTGEDFVRHLFTVAASLDSMVVGESQILSQVKQAYELATSVDRDGTAHECRVSGCPARGQARRHRNGHPAKAGEHSQRRRRRFRQPILRAIRRQAGRRDRRRRNGGRDAPLLDRRGCARHCPGEPQRCQGRRAGRAPRRHAASRGTICTRCSSKRTWSSAPRDPKSRSCPQPSSSGSWPSATSGR